MGRTVTVPGQSSLSFRELYVAGAPLIVAWATPEHCPNLRGGVVLQGLQVAA